MLIQTFEVLTAVLYTSCFRLSWWSSCFQARRSQKIAQCLEATVGGGVGAGGGRGSTQGNKSMWMKVMRI